MNLNPNPCFLAQLRGERFHTCCVARDQHKIVTVAGKPVRIRGPMPDEAPVIRAVPNELNITSSVLHDERHDCLNDDRNLYCQGEPERLERHMRVNREKAAENREHPTEGFRGRAMIKSAANPGRALPGNLACRG